MTDSIDPFELTVHNQDALEELAWAISASQGEFALILARCNYANLRSQLIEQLQARCQPLELRLISLRQSSKTLYSCIREELESGFPNALMIMGFESVENLDEMLSAVNSVREEFRKNYPSPIVLWITEDTHRQWLKLAPDFESWATTTDFHIPSEVLMRALREAGDRLFTTLLAPDVDQFYHSLRQEINLGFLQSSEVDSALKQVLTQRQTLDPELRASVEFGWGLNAPDDGEAIGHYQHSLKYWQQQRQPLRAALLLFYIGYTRFKVAEKTLNPEWEQVRQPLQQCIAMVQPEKAPGLIARAITWLERTLQKLEDWKALETIAQQGKAIHQQYGTPILLVQDYGFLARAALEQQQWTVARQTAQQGLEILEQVPTDRRWLEQRLLMFLAQAERSLNQTDAAIAHLQQALALGDQGYPKAHIHALQELHDLYFEQHQYLEAFQTKQEQLSIEQQYGIRAFVGAGRLRAKREEGQAELWQIYTPVPVQGKVAPEIEAAGRQHDLERLLERIGRNDSRLIVIHGNSGVGKSSLVNAGLVPALRRKPIGIRANMPVVMRVYTNWAEELHHQLERSLQQAGRDTEHLTAIDQPSSDSLLMVFRHLDAHNLRLVLIFDQFEEFFFVYPEPEQRRSFFHFLAECLQILSLNVVVLLREDYLHLLLECDRLPEMSNTGIDILSQNVRYPLGNFSPTDATAIINTLIDRARIYFDPEPTLIEQLVQDLAEELGAVRPIELQIVGAQLQADQITRLAQYQALGTDPKNELVERYLADVVKDCGKENDRAAQLVLYLLTNENDTRPLKTRAELAENMGDEARKLDLVLEILSRSGLVMLLPEVPDDRYQLVHDYLVPYIRQEQGTNLLEELEKERTQRKLSEARLSRLQQTSQIITEARQKAKAEPRYKQRRNWINWQFVLAAFSAAGLVIALRLLGVLEVFELAALDQLFLLRPKEAPDSRIVLVTIDETDLQKQKQWPMSDAMLARLLDKIRQQKPAAIGIDFYRDFSVEPGHQQLQKIFETTPNLIGIQQVSNQGEALVDGPPILKQRDQVGVSDLLIDRDGKIRRGLLYLSDSNNENIFSLSFKLAELYLRSKGIEPTLTKDNQVQIGAAVFPAFESNDGGYAQADSGGYQIILNYRGDIEAFPTISLTDTLADRIPRTFMSGRIVLIAPTAGSFKDQFYTSINGGLFSPPGTTPGAVIHANLTSQLLTAALDDRPNIRVWSKPLEGLWIVTCCLIVAILSWKLRSAPQVVLVTFLAMTGTIAVCYLALLQGWWLPLVPLILALPTVSLLSAVLSNQNFTLESLRRSLQLTIEAYREDPISARLAIEIFLITGDEKITSQEVAAIAIATLGNCHSLEGIAGVASQLLWMPIPPPATLDAAFLQFLDVSRQAQLALTNASSPSSSGQLMESSITTLQHLQENLILNRSKRHTKALKEIAKQWLTILNNTKVSG